MDTTHNLLNRQMRRKFNERKSIINHTDEWFSIVEEKKKKTSLYRKYDKESKEKKLLQLNNNTASNKNKSEFIETSFRVDKWKQDVPTKFKWMVE